MRLWCPFVATASWTAAWSAAGAIAVEISRGFSILGSSAAHGPVESVLLRRLSRQHSAISTDRFGSSAVVHHRNTGTAGGAQRSPAARSKRPSPRRPPVKGAVQISRIRHDGRRSIVMAAAPVDACADPKRPIAGAFRCRAPGSRAVHPSSSPLRSAPTAEPSLGRHGATCVVDVAQFVGSSIAGPLSICLHP
jgi:hypothetical protein